MKRALGIWIVASVSGLFACGGAHAPTSDLSGAPGDRCSSCADGGGSGVIGSDGDATSTGSRDGGTSGSTQGDGGGGACTAAIHSNELSAAPGCWGVSTTYAAAGPSGTRHPAASLKGPIPTNRWWSSLLWNFRGDNPYSQAMYPHPLAARADASGLSLAYVSSPTISGDGRAYIYQLPSTPAGPLGDVTLGIDGMHAASSDVAAFSDWTVTARWADGPKELLATVGKGMPFVYARAHGGPVRLALGSGTVAQASILHDGDEVLAITVGGRPYAAFAPHGATWTKDASGWTSTLAGNDYVSIAVLPDTTPATLALFREHAYAFVTGTRAGWCYDEATARLTTSFALTTEAVEPGASDVPLVSLYPHQWRATSAALTPYTYASPRGTMKLAATKGFDVVRAFTGVLPALPWMGTDDARLRGYVGEIDVDPASLVTDTYGGGKQMAKLANAALVADELGLTAKRDAFLAESRAALQSWFDTTGDVPPLLRYNADWQTIIGYPASFGSDKELNDHHFHWGYAVKSAAIAALYDKAWGSDAAWGGAVKALVRDASNPLHDDAELPFLRNFDVYEGHAWASGHGNFADGNNQESSSESMHYATSLILWGEATGNRTIRDLGVYLYTTEAAAIREYWLDAEGAFPATFKHAAVGIVWGSGGSYSTWWTADPEAIHGINFLPFHGGSLYLGQSPALLRANYEHTVKELGGPEGKSGDASAWKDVIWLAQSLYDPDAALAKFVAQADTYSVEAGETRAHTYHWLASMQALGQVDSTITANATTYAVFARAGTRTYVAYNAACEDRTVHFSDGTDVAVGGRSLVAWTNGKAIRTTALGSCAARPITCH